MARHPHAATALKALPVLKARAMCAVMLAGTTVHAARSRAATCVLKTVAMAKAVPHHAAHVLKVVVKAAAPTVADKAVAKSVANTMATSCHATSIL
jgi:hypothetical protein